MNQLTRRSVLLALALTAPLIAPGRAAEPKPPSAPAPAGGQPPDVAEVVAWAEKLIARLEKIESYTATVVHRERIDGELGEYQYAYFKFRTQPASCYAYFLGPADFKGSELLYVANRDDGRVYAHAGSGMRAKFGTVWRTASEIPRIPWTQPAFLRQLNLRDLTRWYVELLKKHSADATSKARTYVGAKIDGRPCAVYEVDVRDERERLRLRIFADDELKIPNRFELHSSRADDKDLSLQEEFTFVNVKLNAKLTDKDFDLQNPNYRFRIKPAADNAPQRPAEAENRRTEMTPEPPDTSCDCGNGRRLRRWRR